MLKRYGLRADKSLGQNFLQDPTALEAIVSAAGIESTDTVLEIGPGLGSLTRHLAVSAKAVVAVELDQRLIPPLEAILEPYSNVRIVHGDILDLSPGELIESKKYVVVANIPDYITSAVIRHLLESSAKPRRVGVVRSGAVHVGAIAVPLADVTRLDCWAGRKASAATGALAGGALGAFLGAASGIVACQEESIISCEAAGATLALGAAAMGALLGASIGALIYHDTWEEVPLDQVSVGLRPLRDGVGLGANIAF